jgi:hypothetical protein
MAKDIEAIIGAFVAEVEGLAGDGLRAVVLYGSGASGEYRPGRSDLNFLLIVQTVDLPLLGMLQKRIRAWQRRRIATPLVVETTFLSSSADSYPLEILGMMASYRVLRGGDPFEGMAPEREHVRLQVEREVKAKTLLLRRAYMESCGKKERILATLAGALPALQAILRGVLYVQEGDWKRCGPSLHNHCAGQLGIDGGTLDEIQAARVGGRMLSRPDTLQLYEKTLAMFRSLSMLVENAPAAERAGSGRPGGPLSTD